VGGLVNWIASAVISRTQRIRIKVGEKELEVAGPISAADEELIRDIIRRYFEPESGSTGEL
jgi:hypothetical protein